MTDSLEEFPERRWDDKQSQVTGAFQALEKLRPKYRQILGEIMLKVATEFKEKKREADRNKYKGLKELGADKIVGLMKSQNKRRWYDRDPVLHKVYQVMYVLEQEGNPVLSQSMRLAVLYVQEYTDYCTKNHRTEQAREVVALINAVIYKGDEAGERFMINLDQGDDGDLKAEGAEPFNIRSF